MSKITLEGLYQDIEYQKFADYLFTLNGTFNIDYNLESEINYIKQTPYGFSKIKLLDEVRKINKSFITDENYKVTGKKVLNVITRIINLESRVSSKLQQQVEKYPIHEARHIIERIITQPRIQIINRLKQNKFYTLTKLFDYQYLYYLLSPFIDNVQFDQDYKIEYEIDLNQLFQNENIHDNLIWIQDISYTSFSEIVRYYSMIDRVLNKREFTSITSPYDPLILYLNWKEKDIDKSESSNFISNLLVLRTSFNIGYVDYNELKRHLLKFHIPVQIEIIKKPIREIITDSYFKNMIDYNLLSLEQLYSMLVSILPESEKNKLSKLELTNSEDLFKLIKKYELKYPMIYQELFRESLKI